MVQRTMIRFVICYFCLLTLFFMQTDSRRASGRNRAMHIVFTEVLCYNKVKFKYGFGGKDVLDKLEFVIELIYIGGIINARFFRSINK